MLVSIRFQRKKDRSVGSGTGSDVLDLVWPDLRPVFHRDSAEVPRTERDAINRLGERPSRFRRAQQDRDRTGDSDGCPADRRPPTKPRARSARHGRHHRGSAKCLPAAATERVYRADHRRSRSSRNLPPPVFTWFSNSSSCFVLPLAVSTTLAPNSLVLATQGTCRFVTGQRR